MKFSGSILACLSVALLAGCGKEKEQPLPQDRLTVEYSCPTNAIHIGDPVDLVVTTYCPTNGTVEFPEIGRQKEIVLLNRNWEDVPREDGLRQTRTRFSITSFRLGDHAVSDGNILCRVGDRTFTNAFPHVVLHVVSSLSGDSDKDIDDIKPVQKLPGRVPPWLWIVLVAALLAYLVGLVSSKLWKNRENLIPPPPPVPPHVRALQALDELVASGLLEEGNSDPFYTKLSLILREYLEGRFHLNAPEQTTEEIVEELSRSPELTGAQRNILQEFLRRADIVKFAKGNADKKSMEDALGTTKEFINETKDPTDPPGQTDPKK